MGKSGNRELIEGLKASVRFRMRSRMEMAVLDITEGGCMLDSRGWSVKPEERVLVKLRDLGEIGATVAWIEEGRAGLAFEEPLYGPVVERFFA